MSDCVKALRSDEVDALLHSSYVWSYVLQKPSYGDLALQPSSMFSMDFRAGTLDAPEGQAIIARLNRGIAALDDDPVRSLAGTTDIEDIFVYLVILAIGKVLQVVVRFGEYDPVGYSLRS